MADPNPARWRRDAALSRGERRVLAAARQALANLAAYARRTLHESGLDPAVLDDRAPAWRDALSGEVTPAITSVFTDAWDTIDRGTGIDPTPYGTRHIESVWNRLVGTSGEVFDQIRTVIEAGRQEGLHPSVVARDVDALLSDADHWEGRARVIARTETLAANNAGARASARATAEYLGYSPDEVMRVWLATSDSRTRETHLDADGQAVYGSDPYDVGGAALDGPGDPGGPAEEVVNCRCTEQFYFPGDPEYDAGGVNRSSSSPAAPAEVSAPDASAPAAEPVATEPATADDLEAESLTTQERLARNLTDKELRSEVNRRSNSAATKAVARAELRRRGLTAGGAMTAAATEDEPTGVELAGLEAVIVALPAASDPVHGIGDEDKHATLLYFGDAPSDVDLLHQVTSTVAAANGPVTVDVEGVESLGPDGARVWMLDAADLTGLRDALIGTDGEVQTMLDAVEQFPTFTPHVTVGYPEDVTPVDAAPSEDVTVEGSLDDATESAAAAVTAITFDRLAVWAGTEQTEYPLTSGAGDTEETPVPESTTAGARVIAHGNTWTRFGPNPPAPTRWSTAAAQERRRRVTAAAGDPAPVVTEPEQMDAGDPAPTLLMEPGTDYGPNPDRFHGIMTVEDEQTGDGRVFAPGALEWDDSLLPMPLGWQVADAPGHDGSVICGRIDTIERVGNAITYTGTWDLDGAGWETRRLVAGQFLRGISVDVDDVDVVLVTPDGEPVDGFDMFMPMETTDPPVALVQRGRPRSASLCRVPAFAPSGTEGAYIANGLPEDLLAAVAAEVPAEPLPAEDAVAAALVAAAVAYDLPAQDTALPPGEWFHNPQLDTPTPITITDDGRVYGHLAAWGTCHIGVQGTCVTPPRSVTDYAHFAHGVTPTTTGPMITGLLTMDTGHAAPDLRALPAAAHYDNTGAQFATVSVGEDDIGIWVAGAVAPEVTPDQIARVQRAGALSGDWRKIRGNLELVAALAVNTPGFPIPRLSLAASAVEGQTALVAAGIVTHDVAAVDGLAKGLLSYNDVRAMVASALQDERQAEARRGRIAEASARLRASRATAAAARIGG